MKDMTMLHVFLFVTGVILFWKVIKWMTVVVGIGVACAIDGFQKKRKELKDSNQ